MTATVIAAVLAVLWRQNSFPDPTRSCDPVEGELSNLKIGANDAAAVEAVPEHFRYKSKTSPEATERPTIAKSDSIRWQNREDPLQEHTRVRHHSSLAMRTRIESLETRSDLYERELQRLACDVGLWHSSSNYDHSTESSSATDAVDAVTLNMECHTPTASDCRDGEPTASNVSATKHHSLGKSSSNGRSTRGRRNYTTRDLDKLSISGTSKLDLHQNIANTHRKLIRSNKWRNRWSSAGRRWPRRTTERER